MRHRNSKQHSLKIEIAEIRLQIHSIEFIFRSDSKTVREFGKAKTTAALVQTTNLTFYFQYSLSLSHDISPHLLRLKG